MAISCFPTDHLSVHVDDPGYGYVVVCFSSDDEQRWGKNREVTLRGRDMWTALESLTELACRPPDVPVFGDVAKLWPMVVGEARTLLPALQVAVLYAAAGSDRAERLTDTDIDEVHDVLCTRCNEGSYYSGHVTVSEDCGQYGHQPFGYAGNWEQAHETAGWDRRWAEVRKRQARPVTVPTDTAGQPE